MAFDIAGYWDARYQAGGHSGAGSRGVLAAYKASVINGVVAANGVRHVADFGCGDGHLLGLLDVPDYTGLDVSPATLARCAAAFPQYRFLAFDGRAALRPADVAMSIDVIYHLVEDEAFAAYMAALFAASTRLVLIYASNVEANWPAPHVRHRRFTDHVAAVAPHWRLRAHLPNPYPFDPERADATSFADFFVYARGDAPVMVPAP